MTLRELLRTEKMQDAIGGAIGVAIALALYVHIYGWRPTPAHSPPCQAVPYPVGERPPCVRWQP